MSAPEITVSVVIPAFNAERFVPRCLQSVFAQTLKPAEVIVVDDGSKDSTAALAAQLGARVISRKNQGVSAARNIGVENASSEWIAFLDVDDLWAPEKLHRQAASIRADTVLVYTGRRNFDDSGVQSICPAIDAASGRKKLLYCNPITTSSVLARRSAVMQVGGFREPCPPCEDWDLWVRLMRIGMFEAVVDPLTDYYVYSGSLSASPQRMLHGLDQMIDTTLLADLKGLDRWVWRRRIRAQQLCSAGLIARENGLKDELRYMIRSICSWPSPFWEPWRFARFAVSVRNRLRRLDSA